ncbi:MAG: hypothetical protein KDK90_26435 [Leptospiraceae bacterium]|nr:hypothetical protein [Leptospiraceae bacterium]
MAERENLIGKFGVFLGGTGYHYKIKEKEDFSNLLFYYNLAPTYNLNLGTLDLGICYHFAPKGRFHPYFQLGFGYGGSITKVFSGIGVRFHFKKLFLTMGIEPRYVSINKDVEAKVIEVPALFGIGISF